MANGIDTRYTGIGTVPNIIERQDTTLTDFLGFLSEYQDQRRVRNMQERELESKIQAQQDTNEYRQNTLDLEITKQDELKTYRKSQIDNEAARIKVQQDTQAANAQYQKDTVFNNRLKMLPLKDRLERIMLSDVENPGFMKRSGYTKADITQRLADMGDYDNVVDRAAADISSNDPTKIAFHLKQLRNGDMKSHDTAQAIYLELSKQRAVAEKYQKDLYDVTPKEIANAYPAYAKQLESIASSYIQGIDLKDMEGMSGDAMLALMNSQKGAIPPSKMQAYAEAVETLTKSYQNRYRNDRGIGVYEEGKVFPTRENMPDTSVAPPLAPTSIDLVRSQADFQMSPEATSITDDDYALMERLQEEGNPLFEKYLNDEEYMLSDLQTDYDANIKAKQEADKEAEVIQEDIAKTEPPQEDEAATVDAPVGSSLPGDAMAAALEGVDYNEARDALTDAELIAQNQIVQEEVKDDLATYEPGVGWLNSEGERATKAEIEKAQKSQKAQPKKLSSNQRRIVKRLENRISSINENTGMTAEIKTEKIQRLVSQIKQIVPDYKLNI